LGWVPKRSPTEPLEIDGARFFTGWMPFLYPTNSGLAGFIAAKDDGGGGDNWSYNTCKYPIKSSPPSGTNKPTRNFSHAGCPSYHPTNSVKALKGCKWFEPDRKH